MKQVLRRHIRSEKAHYSPEQLKEMSRDIIYRLSRHPLYEKAKVILLYHSIADEVYTHQLISEACRTKKVLLPTVKGDVLELHEYNSAANTHNGPFDIVESEGPLFTDYKNIDLAIIPGMAFDSDGNRLGRGKGYYDRLLPYLECPLIGICFPFQRVGEVPTEAHDRAVDIVIS